MLPTNEFKTTIQNLLVLLYYYWLAFLDGFDVLDELPSFFLL